jgi:hypothetical protein
VRGVSFLMTHNMWSSLGVSKMSLLRVGKRTLCWRCVVRVGKVYLPRLQGVSDEIFHFYLAVFEDLGVKFPFTDFELVVLRCLNVAPSQLQLNS